VRLERTSSLLLWGALSLLAAVGCSDDGGQTGSLLPDECLGPASEVEIVAGDVAFASSQAVSDAILRDSGGNLVETSLEVMGDAVVIRTESALTAGDYSLQASCSGIIEERTLHVAEAAPLPETLGQLTLEPHGPECGDSALLEFALALDPAARPYAALLEIKVTFAEQREFVWVPFGGLDLGEGEAVQLFLPRCEGGEHSRCAPNIETTMQISARIAGEMEALPTLEMPFDGSCESPAAPGLCALGPRASRTPPSTAMGHLLGLGGLLLALLVRRRRT
jgi:hypothetical protein